MRGPSVVLDTVTNEKSTVMAEASAALLASYRNKQEGAFRYVVRRVRPEEMRREIEARRMGRAA